MKNPNPNPDPCQVKNLQFAIDVEPENVDVQRKIVWAQEARARGEP